MRILVSEALEVEKTGVVEEGLVAWVLRILCRWRSSTAPQPRQLRAVETLALGGRRQLTLVVCGTEQFLVGGNAESIETIVRVRSEPSTDTMLPAGLDGRV